MVLNDHHKVITLQVIITLSQLIAYFQWEIWVSETNTANLLLSLLAKKKGDLPTHLGLDTEDTEFPHTIWGEQ